MGEGKKSLLGAQPMRVGWVGDKRTVKKGGLTNGETGITLERIEPITDRMRTA